MQRRLFVSDCLARLFAGRGQFGLQTMQMVCPFFGFQTQVCCWRQAWNLCCAVPIAMRLTEFEVHDSRSVSFGMDDSVGNHLDEPTHYRFGQTWEPVMPQVVVSVALESAPVPAKRSAEAEAEAGRVVAR